MISAYQPTRVQKYVSPIATRLFSVVFLDRRQVASGIRALAGSIKDERGKIHLRMALIRHGLLLPAYRAIPLENIEHYHFSKTITARDLAGAALSFREHSARDEFSGITLGIITGQKIEIKPGEVDYNRILQSITPKILSELQDERDWNGEALKKAFALASRRNGVNRDTLIYRMRKMSDIGGNIQAIIASLFMDRPAADAHKLFQASNGDFLGDLGESVHLRIKEYQDLLAGFTFDGSQLKAKDDYLAKKMAELVVRSDDAQTLLLFFLHKLNEAREANDTTAPIFDEIRYLYAPLAERLSLFFLADDFRDQFLRLSQPKKYEAIDQKVFERLGLSYPEAKVFLSRFVEKLFGYLQKELGAGIQGLTIKFRVKSPYSLWNKVEVRKEYGFEALKDILGVKIICASEDAMLAVRDRLIKKNGLITIKSVADKTERKRGEWRGFKLVGEHKRNDERKILPIEIQIMTREMNHENNWGKAGTWIYNLIKDLDEPGIKKQVFRFKEPPELITANYVENFGQVKAFCKPYLD